MRVVHPSQWKVSGISPMLNRSDILSFPTKTKRSSSRSPAEGNFFERRPSQVKEEPGVAGGARFFYPGVTEKQRKTKFL